MTPYEMEEQLKNLDARTRTIEQILPTLATRQDLRDEVVKLATRDELEALRGDLRLTTAALQHEIETGFEAAKNRAERLEEQIRLVAHQMATKIDLQDTKADLRTLSVELRVIGGDVRAIAKQVAVLRRLITSSILGYPILTYRIDGDHPVSAWPPPHSSAPSGNSRTKD